MIKLLLTGLWVCAVTLGAVAFIYDLLKSSERSNDA